jgi:hypothetical protein
MFTLGMYSTPGTTPSGATAVRYILNATADDNGTNKDIFYGSDLTNVALSAGSPYSPIDCLHSFTLPLTSNATAQNNFKFAVAGTTTGAVLPPTVTISPAP